MSFLDLTLGSIYGILEFFMMRSLKGAGDDIVGNSKIPRLKFIEFRIPKLKFLKENSQNLEFPKNTP